MKPTFILLALLTLSAPLLIVPCPAAESGLGSAGSELNQLCPVSGKAANPAINTVYEGRRYAFADETCKAKWIQDRERSIYHKIGGRPALDAAVESFYVKVLADDRIKHFFDDINMGRQRKKQKEFLSAALGGPIPWTGKDMRKAHANLPGLNDSHFNAVAENLQKTLVELKVSKELIDQIMAIAASTRNDVLNRPK